MLVQVCVPPYTPGHVSVRMGGCGCGLARQPVGVGE